MENLSSDVNIFLEKFYDVENDRVCRNIIVYIIEQGAITQREFNLLVVDNYLNNSGDIYGLLTVLLEKLGVE